LEKGKKMQKEQKSVCSQWFIPTIPSLSIEVKKESKVEESQWKKKDRQIRFQSKF
jgi:hypothetical protein